MRTIQDMIQSEVLCCMSHIVSTLAQTTSYRLPRKTDPCAAENSAHYDLCIQAQELAAPIADYEEAAIQAGWQYNEAREVFVNEGADDDFACVNADAWPDLCDYAGLDPIDREVFEHWAVTDWFADKLIAAGEKVDKDFGNLCIWARTTTGQAIYADGVIERIYAATHQKEEA